MAGTGEAAGASRRSCVGIEKYVELLADVKRLVGASNLIDDLQHAGIDALRIVSRERSFGDDHRLDADELERYFALLVAAGKRRGVNARAKTRQIRFVDIGPHAQLADVAKHDKRLTRRGANVLARADVDLQNAPTNRRADQRPLDFGLGLGDLSFGLATAARAISLSGSHAPAVSSARSAAAWSRWWIASSYCR